MHHPTAFYSIPSSSGLNFRTSLEIKLKILTKKATCLPCLFIHSLEKKQIAAAVKFLQAWSRGVNGRDRELLKNSWKAEEPAGTSMKAGQASGG